MRIPSPISGAATGVPPLDLRYSNRRLQAAWENGIGDITFDGQRTADLVARQLRFAVVKTADGHRLAPETAAARMALEGELGSRLQQALGAAVDAHADGGPAATTVKDITLTTSEPGMRAISMINAVEAGWASAEALTNNPTQARNQFGPVAKIHRRQSGVSASYSPLGGAHTSGHVYLSPMVSRMLLNRLREDSPPRPDRRLRDNWPAYDPVLVLAHELEHTRTPITAGNMSSDRFFEEAGAAILSEWPGRAEKLGHAMGAGIPRRGFEGYKPMATSLRNMLSRAGVDPSSPSDYTAARDLLQGRTARWVPTDLATAIALSNGLPAEMVPDIRDLLREAARSNWRPERLNVHLDRLVKRDNATP